MTKPTAGGSAGGEAGGSQSTENNSGGNGAGGEGEGQSREDRRFSDLTAKLNDKDATIEELNGKITEFETKFREMEDAKDKSGGEMSKVVERLTKDKEDLQGKLDQANGKIAGFETEAFERSLLDEIGTDATAKASLVRGAYREMLATRGLERKPKEGDLKSLAKERKKLLAEDFPELFEQREQPRGGSPPNQGSGAGGRKGRLTL